MLKKLLLLSLALVLSFSLVAFVGCGEKMSQEEKDQIIAGALAASYDTVSFDMDLPMTMVVEGGDAPGTIDVAMNGNGFMDMVNQAMRLAIAMSIEVTGAGAQSLEGEVYVVDGWMYSGMSVPDLGEQWLKMEMTEPMWQQQDQIGPYLELLATAFDIDYKGIEIVNGVECYLFELEPEMGVLTDILLEATASLGAVDLRGFDLAELYQELSVKEWVAKDSYLLQKTEVVITMEIRPEDVGETSDSFDKMNMDVSLTMRFYDYNQPFTVVLPPAALEAEEFSLEMPE